MTDIENEINELKKMIAAVLTKVTPPTAILLSLSQAAEVCNVEKRWLLERVQFKDIPAYRSGLNAPWRVYAADVNKFLTQNTNIKTERSKRVLRVA